MTNFIDFKSSTQKGGHGTDEKNMDESEGISSLD